jgi:YVTN family beta-propeller protein
MKTLAALLLSTTTTFGAEQFALKATVPLAGVKGRFDHFALDTNAHRLFVAALGNNTVEIIDTAGAQRLRTIPDQHKPCGIAFLPATKRLFVANGDDGSVKVYDSESYRLVKSITGLDDADNVRYDAKADLLYVGFGDGALGVIDPAKLEIVARIKLKAHPESFQLEQNGPRIFVNVPDARQITVVEREKRAIVATWPMEKFRANFPMALDDANHRLFAGCRQPARVVVLETETGKLLTDFAISGDTDDLFWDAARKRLYISCGEGFVDVFGETGGTFTRTAHVATRAGARTSYFAPPFSEFYLAVPDRNGAAAELRIFTAEIFKNLK